MKILINLKLIILNNFLLVIFKFGIIGRDKNESVKNGLKLIFGVIIFIVLWRCFKLCLIFVYFLFVIRLLILSWIEVRIFLFFIIIILLCIFFNFLVINSMFLLFVLVIIRLWELWVIVVLIVFFFIFNFFNILSFMFLEVLCFLIIEIFIKLLLGEVIKSFLFVFFIELMLLILSFKWRFFNLFGIIFIVFNFLKFLLLMLILKLFLFKEGRFIELLYFDCVL